MADVYLSYAREDRRLAERIADELGGRGLSVWWDVQLTPGQSWDRVIGRELDAAKAVVALFTENSVHSNFIREEASVGQSQGKLIPVVFGQVVAPIGFHRIATINGDAPNLIELLYAAIQAKIAAPASQPRAAGSAPSHQPPPYQGDAKAGALSPIAMSLVALRTLRTQSFYWFGIGGAVVTLAGNLDAFILLADWLQWVNLHWSALITWFWNLVIPFDLHVLPEDAVIMTLVAVLFFNLLLTSTYRDRSVITRALDVALLLTALALTAYVGFAGFVHELDSAQVGIADLVMNPLLAMLNRILPDAETLATFSLMTLGGALATSVVYAPLALIFSVRPNVPAFAARLWRILLGLLLIVVANQLSLWIETYDWNRVTG